MKIFLTGGSGFLGTSFIKYILTREDASTVVALSRSSVSDEKIHRACEEVKGGKERVRIVRGSINDEGAVREGLNGVDVVVHMAAKVQPWGFYEEFRKTTVEGTRLLLSCIESMSQKPRLIHISSFTALINRHFPEGTIPDWAPYSKSKCFAEDSVLNSSTADVISLRLGWLWGKDDDVLLPKLHNFCVKMLPIWKVIPHSYPLSILHVENACESIHLACKIPKDQISVNTDNDDGDTTPLRKVYEIEDGTVGIEDFADFYVGAAYNMKPPRPFEKFRLPKWLVWGLVTGIEWIPLLGYAKRWVIEGINRESLFCIFKDYRLQPKDAVEELGYIGKVSREEGLAEIIAKHTTTSQ